MNTKNIKNSLKDDIENTLINRHTKEIHEKIKNAKVAIAGLGGLGSNIAESLIRAGIGELFLVDFDKVDISNINRQNYLIEDLGEYKTKALKNHLLKINPYSKIKIKNIKIDEYNIKELFYEYEIICEALDNPKSKAIFVNTCLKDMPNKKIISGSGMAGLCSSNIIKTQRRLKNLYICGDGENGIEKYGTLFSSRVQICAGHQANMVLRLIIGETEP